MSAVESPTAVQINIVSAMNCEAKEVIDRYRLKKVMDRPFALFSGVARCSDVADDLTPMNVVITGIGAINMATAVGWLAARQTDSRSIWLNLGIAGHGCLEIGDSFIVAASYDETSSKVYYPPQVARRPTQSGLCLTVTSPTHDYPENGGVDMEVSSFYQAANRFADSECVQAFKVVSDNPNHGIENLNASYIQQLMRPHINLVTQFIDGLFKLVSASPSLSVRILLPSLRASHSQTQQMQKMASQLDHLLDADSVNNINQQLQSVSQIDEVLSMLGEALHDFQPELDSSTEGVKRDG